MRCSILLGLMMCFLISCSNQKNDTKYLSIGKKIEVKSSISVDELKKEYAQLQRGDTIQAKVKGTIKDVCSVKGCWMTLDVGNDEEVMVKFKDYAFFVPTNADGDVERHL